MSPWLVRLVTALVPFALAGCDAGEEQVVGALGSSRLAVRQHCADAAPPRGLWRTGASRSVAPASEWQRAAEEHAFVLVELTRGVAAPSEVALADVDAAVAAGLFVVPVLRADWSVPVAAQADAFVAAWSALPPAARQAAVVDVEDSETPSLPVERADAASALLRRLTQVLDRPAMLATSAWYWEGWLEAPDQLADAPLVWAEFSERDDEVLAGLACARVTDGLSAPLLWAHAPSAPSDAPLPTAIRVIAPRGIDAVVDLDADDAPRAGCVYDAECAAGDVCAWGGAAYCCQPAGASGEPCVDNTSCGGAEVCAWNGAGFVCAEPRCR